MTRIWLALLAMGTATVAVAAPLPPIDGPVVDQAGLLSPQTRQRVDEAAETFRRATGHWMIVIALPAGRRIDLSPLETVLVAPWEASLPRTPVGIVYATAPDDPAGALLVVDPAWRAVSHEAWIPMFPRRLAQKYGDKPLGERVALSARYLAEVFPDKIALLLRPPGQISAESIEFAENVMTGVKWFIYFIILFTFVRTIFPARLRDEDNDEFSQELRRLSKERRIW